MPKQTNKIAIGISSCLLGQKVRYDGQHKNDAYLQKTLGGVFVFKAYCPEVDSGMSIPRPPMQLRDTEHGVRCVNVADASIDVTTQLQTAAARQQHWLAGLSGYILKKGSPSCGMAQVKIYKNDFPEAIGTGIFAQYIQDHFPLLPIAEEAQLHDPKLREDFIQRVYAMHRWQQLNLI